MAVGGTSLTIATNGSRISETAWSSGGGGPSRYEVEVPFQRSVQNSGKRTTPDVAYNADTNRGFYVYDSVAGPERSDGLVFLRRHQRQRAAVGRPDRLGRPGPRLR